MFFTPNLLWLDVLWLHFENVTRLEVVGLDILLRLAPKAMLLLAIGISLTSLHLDSRPSSYHCQCLVPIDIPPLCSAKKP